MKMYELNEKPNLLRLGKLLAYAVSLATMVLPFSSAWGASSWEYYQHDRQGSLIAAYDESGTTLVDNQWTPYGELYKSYPAGGASSYTESQSYVERFKDGIPVRRGFTGHKTLFLSGLTFAGDTRLYDPALKRFYNTDDRMTGGIRGSNRFSYAYNNPLKFVDTDGHMPIVVEGFITALGDFGREQYSAFANHGLKTGLTDLALAIPRGFFHGFWVGAQQVGNSLADPATWPLAALTVSAGIHLYMTGSELSEYFFNQSLEAILRSAGTGGDATKVSPDGTTMPRLTGLNARIMVVAGSKLLTNVASQSVKWAGGHDYDYIPGTKAALITGIGGAFADEFIHGASLDTVMNQRLPIRDEGEVGVNFLRNNRGDRGSAYWWARMVHGLAATGFGMWGTAAAGGGGADLASTFLIGLGDATSIGAIKAYETWYGDTRFQDRAFILGLGYAGTTTGLIPMGLTWGIGALHGHPPTWQ
ncbi:RHS repeat-associated core domain-containing protein [Marinobacter gudaonensis]|uniref:RHS repeat-associated core domain-containing protein n=1 Tax=Marinobacter gudaonensis TaxID=375760 RepID=A0A1I6HZN0_9GAMM|nr:RHS repeat-associated core domain-containing protein [Marinobacter gudaonensis]SFR59897.1 RHS repeat-associated core domain-containing protein [Marinobacter gudaonensis]